MSVPLSSRRRAEPESSESEEDTDPEAEPADPPTDSLSFEELLRLQSSGEGRSASKSTKNPKKPKDREQLRRAGPLEMSSKCPAPFLRKVTPSKKVMRRDPRFDDLSGEFKAEVFANSYKFLEDVRRNERQIVEKKLRKSRNPEMREKLQQLIHRMDQQEVAAEKKQKMREREQEYKRQVREDARQGKRPYFMKKGDLRKVELADKYRDLKKRGKLEHFLSKKRKRNSHKDRRRLPNQ